MADRGVGSAICKAPGQPATPRIAFQRKIIDLLLEAT